MGYIKVGDHVAWKWGSGMAEGEVLEVHSKRTQIESKGTLVTRNGSKENQAVIILHKSGNEVLKLASELQVGKNEH